MISTLVFTAVFSYAVAPEWVVKLPGVAYWMPAALLTAMLWIVWSVTGKADATSAVGP